MKRDIRGHHLYFDGCDTVELAHLYGTPLYLISLTKIEKRIMELKEALRPYEKTRIAYAAKAFLTLGMARIVERLGLCLDVVSMGELEVALASGFPPERIEFNGNNKLDKELELALSHQVGRIILDGADEAERLEVLARAKGTKVNVLLRLTPGIQADTHEYIVTGKKDSKFGFPLDSKALRDTMDLCLRSDHIELLGYHFHAGSQLHEVDVYMQSLKQVLSFAKQTYDRTGFVPVELNVGGGFGVRYTSDDQPLPFRDFFAPMLQAITVFFHDNNWPLPEIVTEPGRSLIAEAGITLYEIGSLKEIEGIRNFVSVDGGMSDNIRPALYQAKYHAILANRADEESEGVYTMTGKICESGDIIINDIALPKPNRGDIAAVFSTGAYGYAMASNYNKLPVPAVVILKEGRHELFVRRQSMEDLMRNDLIPQMVEEL